MNDESLNGMITMFEDVYLEELYYSLILERVSKVYVRVQQQIKNISLFSEFKTFIK